MSQTPTNPDQLVMRPAAVDAGNALTDAVKLAAAEIGINITADLTAVAAYAAERATVLSLAVGQPGYEEALQAERDNVALRLATVALTGAKRVDGLILGTIHGALSVAARAILVA